MALPVSLIAAVATQVLCQLFKVFFYSVRDNRKSGARRLDFHYFFTSGGMPSAHSAFVTALCVGIAVHGGWTSDVFAACAVFGFIVMHDAYRLRGTVEKQSKIINRLLVERPVADGRDMPELPERIGHTVSEIAVGIVVGAVLGAAFVLLLEHA